MGYAGKGTDYLEAFSSLYGEKGFKRLWKEGLLLDKLCGWYFDMTFVHRIIDGLVYPLSLMIVPENTIDSMDIFVPFIYMLCYAGIPAATHLGYYFGYTQKFNKDDIMYQ